MTGRLQVRLGELNMKSNGEPLDHQDRAILDYRIHPKFDNFTKENDIALLKIDETGLQFQVMKLLLLNKIQVMSPISAKHYTNLSAEISFFDIS